MLLHLFKSGENTMTFKTVGKKSECVLFLYLLIFILFFLLTPTMEWRLLAY